MPRVLTAGDIDVLKNINPVTLHFHTKDFDTEDLWLVCSRIKDASVEPQAYIIQMREGISLDEVLGALIDHQRECHEPKGHK